MSELENKGTEALLDNDDCNGEPEIEIEIGEILLDATDPEIEISIEAQDFPGEITESRQVCCADGDAMMAVTAEEMSACFDMSNGKIFDGFCLRMKWEHKTFGIYEKVHIVFAVLFGLISLLYMVLSFVTDKGFSIYFGINTYYYFAFAAYFIALSVVYNVSKHKLAKYVEGVVCNCAPSVKRYSSVGVMIFTFIFSKVAFVFYVINFIFVKRNRRCFEEISKQQVSRYVTVS